MTAGAQMALPVEATLPLDPAALLDLSPKERGRHYAALDLDSWQIACVEEARRRILAGTYPGAMP